jgi:hypothetical protein
MTNEELLQALLGTSARAPAVDPLSAPECDLSEAHLTPVGECRTMDVGAGVVLFFERKGADAYAFSLVDRERQTCNYSAGSMDAMTSFYIAAVATVAVLGLFDLVKGDKKPEPPAPAHAGAHGLGLMALLKAMDELEAEMEDEDGAESTAD